MHARCLCAGLTLALTLGAFAAEPRGRAVLLVDNAVYPGVRAGLDTYAAHVLKQQNIVCEARPDDYYKMQPPEIRALLKKEYEASKPELVGAVMVGPIPCAVKGDPAEILIPLTLYYEDFDAQYDDKNGDGCYQDSEVKNDRLNNPTEIWTSWWVPPCAADDIDGQVKHLNTFLAKLDRYYKDEITGRDAMLWAAGNVAHVETVEGWTVLMKDTMNAGAKPLNEQLYIWCRFGQDEGSFRPNKRAEEFSARDFLKAFTLQPWRHVHVIAHGNQRGWYWDTTGVVAASDPNKPESTLKLDFSTMKGGAANIVTTSGCGNGNFRGDYGATPRYERFLGSLLLFSPDTITVAYYGAASPQSTSGDPGFCTEIVESLQADKGSYLAAGYKKMRNMDYSWGTQHYFFRGGDEKVLSGDPFAKFRPAQPRSAEQKQALEEKIKAANWTIVGPG